MLFDKSTLQNRKRRRITKNNRRKDEQEITRELEDEEIEQIISEDR